MKKILFVLLSICVSSNVIAKPYSNEKDFNRYLKEYGQNSALFELCGEADRADIANIAIYFDEIVTPKFLKQQIQKYGSQEKAGAAAMNIADKASNQEKHRLVDKGFSIEDCQSLYQEQ